MAANRARLSLAELGEFDDLLTDALVDKVYYWTKIRKTKRLYLPSRRVVEKDVALIVADYVVRARSVTAAVEKFEQLNGIQTFLQGLEEWKKNEFMKHVRRYMQIYHPEAPFEVNSTDRYTLFTHEACVHARRSIRAGEAIKFLAGCMLLMTDEEEASLDDNSDFSVICTSRMKGTSVLLGPARFVNHDCDPNCKFITTNKDNITIMAIRNIGMGEEITIKYSEDYFGENNCECLCQTCESRAQNGFAIVGGKTKTMAAELMAVLEEDTKAYSFRLGRRNAARISPGNPPTLSRSASTPAHVELESQLPPSVPTKQGSSLVESTLTPPQSEAGPTSEDELQLEAQLEAQPEAQPGAQPTATMDTPEVTPSPDVAKAITIEASPPVPGSPLASEGSAVEANPNEQYSDQDDSDCDSELSEIDEAEYQKLLEMFSPSISARYKYKRKRDSEDVQSSSNSLKRTKASSLERTKPPAAKSHAIPQGPDTEKKIKRKRDPEENQPPPKRSKPQMPNPFKYSFKRFPGDSALIPKNGLKCICTDCGQTFWNMETWFVPMSCNRCLRHSKIYGLRWPKTFKRKNDQELEIQDHRELSRYITVAEFYKLSKKQREEEEVAREAKNKRASGGGRKKTGTGEENTGGLIGGGITKKKGSEVNESAVKGKKVFMVEIVKAEGGEGKENISTVVLAAKANDEKPPTPVEVPVVQKKPSAPRKALAEGKGKKVTVVGLPIGEVLRTDGAIDGRVIKKKALVPQVRIPAKSKTVVGAAGPTPVPISAPAAPVAES